jgi:hypothetical protein
LAGTLALDRAALGDLVDVTGATLSGSVIANTLTQLQRAATVTSPDYTVGTDITVDTDLTLDTAVTIADGVTLTIASGATLTSNGAIDGSGTGTINGTGSLVLAAATANLTDVTLDLATTVNAAVTFDGVTASDEITIADSTELTFANSAGLNGATVVFGTGSTLAGAGVATELLVESLSADSGAGTPVITINPLDAWDNTGGESISLNSTAIDLSGVDDADVTNATSSAPAAGTVTLAPADNNTTPITVDDANTTTLGAGQDLEVIRDGVTYQATVQ